MEENTITLTQAELDAKVEEAVANATKELESKHNKAMYDLRQENKNLKNANKSQEDLAKEQDEEVKRELDELRAFKKSTVLRDRLAKEGLPSHYQYDTRLINATDDEFEKVLKGIKKEYDDLQPKGNPHSTVVQTSGNKPQVSEKDKANQEMAQALAQVIGR